MTGGCAVTDWALENLSTIVHRAVDGFDDPHQGWAQVLGWPVEQIEANPAHARALATAAIARSAIAEHLGQTAPANGEAQAAPGPVAPSDGRPAAATASGANFDDAAAGLRWRASQGPERSDPIAQLPEEQRGAAVDFVNRTTAEARGPYRAIHAFGARPEQSASTEGALAYGEAVGRRLTAALNPSITSSTNSNQLGVEDGIGPSSTPIATCSPTKGAVPKAPIGSVRVQSHPSIGTDRPDPTVITPNDWKVLRSHFPSTRVAAQEIAKIAQHYLPNHEWSAIFVEDGYGNVFIAGLHIENSTHHGTIRFDLSPPGRTIVGDWHLHPTRSRTSTEFSDTDYDHTYAAQHPSHDNGLDKYKLSPEFISYMTDGSDRRPNAKWTSYALPQNIPEAAQLYGQHKEVPLFYDPKDDVFHAGSTSGHVLDLSNPPDGMRSTLTPLQLTMYDPHAKDGKYIYERSVFPGQIVADPQSITTKLPKLKMPLKK